VSCYHNLYFLLETSLQYCSHSFSVQCLNLIIVTGIISDMTISHILDSQRLYIFVNVCVCVYVYDSSWKRYFTHLKLTKIDSFLKDFDIYTIKTIINIMKETSYRPKKIDKTMYLCN
jgi:hypothetical protein